MMVVTLPCDDGYSSTFQLSAYFGSAEGVKMRKDQREVSEILKFDLFEETVGSWPRSTIRLLEEERTAIQTESLVDHSPDRTRSELIGKACRRRLSLFDSKRSARMRFSD